VIITIDGPAGTGKSSVARAVAQRLGFDFLDTGAMYRAIALEASRRQAKLEDARELTFIAKHSKIKFDYSEFPPRVMLNGDDVGHLLRSGETTRAASFVAIVPAIRELLVAQQRRIGRERQNLVTEGRDQGSVVFPDAEFKFYLDATAQERARRRAAQLRARGEVVDFNSILEQIVARDDRDSTRKIAPLAVPKGARVIDTTHMSEQQVIDHIVAAVSKAEVSRSA
jgi:cytidylate kinase